MPRGKAAGLSENCCEKCRFYIQHYIKVPFVDADYNKTDDGYCVHKRRKHVRSHWSCDGFMAKGEAKYAGRCEKE